MDRRRFVQGAIASGVVLTARGLAAKPTARRAGNRSGACTTSGMAWKLHGRVGDNPIAAKQDALVPGKSTC